MQYNYDFHLHHQRVEASQMLGEFESFYYNRNLHNIPWYEKPNFLPASHLMRCIDSEIPGKGLFIVLKKLSREGENSCFFIPSPRKP